MQLEPMQVAMTNSHVIATSEDLEDVSRFVALTKRWVSGGVPWAPVGHAGRGVYLELPE